MKIVLMLAAALAITSLSGLVGCADFAYRSPGTYEGGPMVGSGTYLAEALVETPEGAPQRFNIFFSRKPVGGFALLTALATSGKPLFRARDPLAADQKPVLTFYPTEVTLTHAQLAAFYEGLRPLFLLSDNPAHSSPLVKFRHNDGRPRSLAMPEGPTLNLKEYDWQGHAFRLLLEGNDWKAEVTLREFKI